MIETEFLHLKNYWKHLFIHEHIRYRKSCITIQCANNIVMVVCDVLVVSIY